MPVSAADEPSKIIYESKIDFVRKRLYNHVKCFSMVYFAQCFCFHRRNEKNQEKKKTTLNNQKENKVSKQ